jgi:hypothetical protein
LSTAADKAIGASALAATNDLRVMRLDDCTSGDNDIIYGAYKQ